LLLPRDEHAVALSFSSQVAIAERFGSERGGAPSRNKTLGRIAMLTLYQLEVFIAVAKHLNITRAARALHVSQSAVSQQIERLEGNLRVTLIMKSRRGIDLTEAGVSVRIESEKILARVNALKKNYGRGISTMIFPLTASQGLAALLLL
jgi:DNA-binding transcriptional LysR family regulator